MLTVQELLYYIFWISMLISKGIGLYDGQSTYKVFLLIGVACILLKIVMTRHTIGELIFIALFLFLTGLIYLKTGDKGAFICAMTIVGLKNISVKKLFMIGGIVWTGCFGIMVLLTGTKMVDSLFLVHEKLGLGPVLRWTFGYTHPNVLHITYVVLIAFLFYLIPTKYFWRTFVVSAVGNIFVFLYSLSFTGFALTFIFLAFQIYFRKRKKFTKQEMVIMQFILPLCLMFSFFAPYLLHGKLFDLVNRALNTRLLAIRVYFDNYPINILGNRFSDVPDMTFAIDNSYVSALLSYGLLFFTLIMCLYFFTIYTRVKEGNREELVIILSFLIAGISEPFLFNTSFKNLSLLFIGECLYQGSILNRNTLLKKEINGFKIGEKILLKSANKKVDVTLPKRLKKQKYQMLLGILVGALIGGYLCLVITKWPQTICVETDWCDSQQGRMVTIDSNQIDVNNEVWLIGNIDENSQMHEFSGNIVTLEKVRITILWMLIGAMITTTVILILQFSINRYKRSEV